MSTSSQRRPKSGVKPAAKAKPQSKARKIAGAFGRSLLTVFLIFVITCTLVGGALAIYVINFVTPQNINLDSANLDTTTTIYANDTKTNQPTEVAQVSGSENRIWVSISQIPTNLQNAYICTEDERFYEHNGVDWKRTVSSFANLIFHFYGSAQGGSTITQQLVNNITQAGKGVNYGRKIQEIVNALALEKKYPDKKQILEAYLNTINLNEGCYGVETAAENYFGKPVQDLDLAECAALACLPKAPATYDPRNHPDKNTERRVGVILENMLKQKKITQQQFDQASKEKLKIVAKKTQSTRGWFEDMVLSDVQNDLMNKYGWTSEYALDYIYTKGLKIYTTMNPDVQSAMDKVYTDSKNTNYWYQYSGTVQPQSSMMIVNYSGQIVGVEGGRGQKTGNMVYDRATQALRPPGSSLKPLGVYAPAIDLNKITWSSLISCGQIRVPGNPNPWPQNDFNIAASYKGSLSVVAALAQSVNTVAVNIDQNDLSSQYTFDFLTKKLGFSLDPKKDANAGIAIGSVTGVTAKEMAGGYEIFGNNGLYTKPYSYTKVVDNQGNVILQNKPIATQVIGADTAFVMNQLLQQDVTRNDGTGRRAAIPGVVVGGKTGTTNDHKDRWFCGITPDYVGVVWFGYDTPKDIPGYKTDTNPALKAWQAVMAIADKNPVKTSFPANGDVVQEPYDPATGYVTQKPTTAYGWYKVDNIPAAPVPASYS